MFNLFIWDILILYFFNQLLKLSSGIFHGSDRGYLLYTVYLGLVLCNFWFEFGDRYLLRRLLFSCLFDSLFKLFVRNIFILFVISKLFKLFRWNFHGGDWGYCMHVLSRGLLLRHRGPHGRNRRMQSRKIFEYLSNDMLKLSCGDIHIVNRCNIMFSMSWGLLLCNFGSFSSDRHLCCGLVFSRHVNCLFNLFVRGICILRISYRLFKLSRGNIRRWFRIECMFKLCCGLLYRIYGAVKLHELLRWKISCVDRSFGLDKLRELLRRLFPVTCCCVKLH